jgi:uncharacterized protein with HEPN domain
VFFARLKESSDGEVPGYLCPTHLEAIANIEADTSHYNFEKFRADRRARQLVERNLEILSEASRRIPKKLKDGEGHISWRAIAGFGNVLRHDYLDTYPTILWDTCEKDLQPLKEAVERIGAVIAGLRTDADDTK